MITQSFLVRLGCSLDTRQLLQRVSQSYYRDGVNLNIFNFFVHFFHLPFFWSFLVHQLQIDLLSSIFTFSGIQSAYPHFLVDLFKL